MMPAPPAPTNGVAKPPKLKIDKKYGGTNPAAKYKVVSDFRKMHRAHWWLLGYDVKVLHENQTECRLTCATHLSSCPYNAVAEFTHFPELNSNGWRIKPGAFNPQHDHPAPYVPMEQARENARRSRLQHDDPSLENPPLVPVSHAGMAGSAASSGDGRGGFARAGSASTSVQGSGTGGAGGAHYPPQGMQQHQQQQPPPQQQHQQQTPAYGSPAMNQAQHLPPASQGGGAPGSAYSPSFGDSFQTPQPQPHPQQQQPQQPPYQSRPSYSSNPSQQGSMPPPAVPYQHQQPQYAPPPPQQQQYGYPPQQQHQHQQMHTPASSSTFGTPAPPPSASSSSVRGTGGIAPQATANAANAHLRTTPLGAFLLNISPSFSSHLHLFEAHSEVIPLSTDPSELLDLDTPTDPTDRAIFDTFKDVPGLPPFMVALAADGVRKARKRRDLAIAQGRWIPGVSKEEGRIAVGIEKAKAEKWVKMKIAEGERILAQRAAAAAGQQGGMQQPMQGVQVGPARM